MSQKFHVRSGDTVVVISGENTGDQGKVLSVDRDSARATVEGVNMKKQNVRKSQDNPQGGILEKEMPLHVSNLKVVSEAKK